MAARKLFHPPSILPLAGLFVLTLGLTLLGTLTRPIESLSLFWPINAILLGLLLRQASLATPPGWLAIYLGMVAADLLTGNDLLTALWLNACNMGLLLTAWYLMVHLPGQPRLEHPLALLHLLLACAAGAAVAASLACTMDGARWFDGTLQTTWLSWFTEQFSTCLLILPALLTAPRSWHRPNLHELRLLRALPLLALLASLAAGLVIGGPGALAFPVPALLWCALRYRLFTLAVLTMLTGLVEIVGVAGSLTFYGVAQHSLDDSALMSARLGISMLVMGPLVVAVATTINRQLLERLEHRANHDTLTGALMRNALAQQTSALLERRRQQPGSSPLSLLMIDIDHFKAINDTHGHAMGDQVLRTFAAELRQQLRQGELFGRLGGEEFAVVLPGANRVEALHIAERLRATVERLQFPLADGGTLRITVSIGVATLGEREYDLPLEQALLRADMALYQAKAQGRNRVMMAEERPD
ncbi:GGDEF domain-containing protein [Zestomonas thermotolerans]|uniref:GGDEF domain-containing protein n=1 Tax=Zestomonas thermotolerans TaxID=157784 RepID=UPI0004878449|nr:GGDEF domain-containing protein [Pseudomonas thermotolerans]